MKKFPLALRMTLLGIILVCGFDLRLVTAEEGVLEYGYCTNPDKLKDIPIGDFSKFVWPQRQRVCPADKPKCTVGERVALGGDVMRITQKYKNSYEEGFSLDGKWTWGHDGIDIHEKGLTTSGINDILALQGGKVVVSKTDDSTGWGNRITIATRVPYSEQIITVNYAHMHEKTLQFGKCTNVQQGVQIGKEGSTGVGTATHVHVTLRLWENLEELKKGLEKGNGQDGLFQKGYGRSDESYFRDNHYLDAYFLISGRFQEFECQGGGCPTWAKAPALAARRAGMDLGRYDRYFAVNPSSAATPVDLLESGEAARWLKVGRRFKTFNPPNATYTDVPVTSSLFPYVETLVKEGVFSSGGDCDPVQPGRQFCPDQIQFRLELVHLVVFTFMKKEFDEWMKNKAAWDPWNTGVGKYYKEVENDQYFKDLHENGGWHKYADDILFAAFNSYQPIIEKKANFGITDRINKLEAAKIMMAARGWYLSKQGEDQYDPCDYTYCATNQRCIYEQIGSSTPSIPDLYEVSCLTLEECDPEKKLVKCEYGGGSGTPICQNPLCTAGQEKQQSCGNGGIQTAICSDECQWSAWGDCIGGGSCNSGQISSCGNCGTMTCGPNGIWGVCSNQGLCAPGDTQEQSCNGGTGTQTRTCAVNCSWGPFGPCNPNGGNCVCQSGVCCDGCNYLSAAVLCDQWNVYQCQGFSPGQDAQQALVQQYCSGADSGCSGSTQQQAWQLSQDCSANQVCQMSGGTASCVAQQCQDVYFQSGSPACYGNPQGSGNPTLCLEVQQNSGSIWQYRVCKQGVTFGNNFTYHLQDDNLSQIFPDYLGQMGSSCSAWQNANINYLPGTGPVNGAGLMVYMSSPSGCVQPACQYTTGYVTIYKQCQ